MTTGKYKIIVPDYEYGSPFFYVCASLEELCSIYKFVEGYHLYLDVYTNITVQRSRTKKELLDSWYDKDYVCLTEDDPDYWIPFTDEFVELIKTKTVRL
jgi:hypothetical protein